MKLQAKLIILVVTLIVTPLLILGGITYTQLRETSTAQVFRSIDTLMDQVQQDLESTLQTTQSNLALFANSPLLRKYMLTTDEAKRYRLMQLPLLELFSSYQQAYPDYYEIRVLLPDSYEDARMTLGNIPNITEEEAESPFFQELQQHPEHEYITFFTNPDTQKIALLVAKKLFLAPPYSNPTFAQPTLRGYLLITVSLDSLQARIHQLHIGEQDHFFLTDGQGQILLHEHGQHIPPPPLVLDRMRYLADNNEVTQALYSNQSTYFKIRQLDPNLFLFAAIPKAQLLTASRGLGKWVASLTLAVIVITVFLMLVMLKYLVANPIHRLRRATREITRGNLQTTIALNSHDEIGELCQDFEQMRQSLYHSQLEVKTYQQSLQEKAIAAEAASRAKSTFLATMSHEIRTPLNGVIGPVELLQATSLDQKQRQYLEMMTHSAESLLDIINNVLDLSKIEAGKIVLETIDFNLRELIEETTESMAITAQRKGLELTCLITQQVPTKVNGDPVRLRQILLILLSNAVKFTEHGEIAVQVEVTSTTEEHTILRFQVRDTGIGIEPEALGSIFNAFSQADSSTTRKYGGTGLGLSIMQQLIELMNGEAGVQSQPGKGSVFWFSARFAAVSPQRYRSITSATNELDTTAQMTATKNSTKQCATHILLAEDNPINQKITKNMLKDLGCQVDIVEDGQKALGAYENKCYDLIFMDCQMPNLDGFEATQRIRKLEVENQRTHTPIIAITANAFKEDRDRCLEVGMNDYLSKPFKQKQLKMILERWTIDYLKENSQN